MCRTKTDPGRRLISSDGQCGRTGTRSRYVPVSRLSLFSQGPGVWLSGNGVLRRSETKKETKQRASSFVGKKKQRASRVLQNSNPVEHGSGNAQENGERGLE